MALQLMTSGTLLYFLVCEFTQRYVGNYLVGVADLSALYKLFEFINNKSLKLGGKGIGQCCFLCRCTRGCECDGQTGLDRRSSPCNECQDSVKFAIGSIEFTVLQDDLSNKLGIPLERIAICILHSEMRNEGTYDSH